MGYTWEKFTAYLHKKSCYLLIHIIINLSLFSGWLGYAFNLQKSIIDWTIQNASCCQVLSTTTRTTTTVSTTSSNNNTINMEEESDLIRLRKSVTVGKETWLGSTMGMKLWRVMITHILKGPAHKSRLKMIKILFQSLGFPSTSKQ